MSKAAKFNIIISGVTTGFEGYSRNSFGWSVLGGAKNWGMAVGTNWIAGNYKEQNNPANEPELAKKDNGNDNNSPWGFTQGSLRQDNGNSKQMSDVDKSNSVTIIKALMKAMIEKINGNVVVIDMNKQSEFNAKDYRGIDMLLLTQDIDRPEITLHPLNRVKQNEKNIVAKINPLTPFSPDDKYYILTNWNLYKGVTKNINDIKLDVRGHEYVHIGLNSMGWPSIHGIDAVESVLNTFRKYFQKTNF